FLRLPLAYDSAPKSVMVVPADSNRQGAQRSAHSLAFPLNPITKGERHMSKVVCVLYDDPIGGYPKSYARDDIPKIDRYPGGQSAPTPKRIDFKPFELLGSVSGELGLRKFLEGRGHTFVVTSDKEGPTSVFERELPDAEV